MISYMNFAPPFLHKRFNIYAKEIRYIQKRFDIYVQDLDRFN